jgi:outer membrane protein assembly factor BamD (BamD/ComL family)
MSVTGISGNNFVDYNTQKIQSTMQKFTQEFQQLGADLQSGNLSAAQADFATLQQDGPTTSTSSTQSNNPISQLFNQLSQDLKSGNLSAAQQDYSSIQQDLQNQSSGVHHRHHHGAGNGGEINQLFEQLGQDLQSGNVSAAQQAYNTLAQDFTQIGQTTAAGSSQQLAQPISSVSLIA